MHGRLHYASHCFPLIFVYLLTRWPHALAITYIVALHLHTRAWCPRGEGWGGMNKYLRINMCEYEEINGEHTAITAPVARTQEM